MKTQSDSIRLTIELVPGSSWGRNVRKVVSDETWEELRFALMPYDIVCSICGYSDSEESLHLHEEWQYDDSSKTQTLVSLVPLCQYCHEVKHIGRAMKVGDGDRAIAHLRRINGWEENEVLRYVHDALHRWEQRSSQDWTLDMSMLSKFVPETRIHMNWLDRSVNRPSNPLEARIWAWQALESDALIIDTETTGLPNQHSRAEIIEIAVLNVSGEVILDELIKPKYPIPKRTIKINGITNEDVTDGPSFPDVFNKLYDVLHGARLIAYKSEFDHAILAKTCSMYDLEPPNCQWDCAMWAYYFYKGADGRLPGLPKAGHRAGDDCRALIDLLHQMARGHGKYYGKTDLSRSKKL